MQPKYLSTDKWIKKMCIYIHNELLLILSHKKKSDILLFATVWMDLEGLMISELNHGETNTIFVELKNMTTSKYNKKETDSQIEQN